MTLHASSTATPARSPPASARPVCWFGWNGLGHWPAWLISTLLHLTGIGVLAVLTLGPSAAPIGVILVATHAAPQENERLELLEFEINQETPVPDLAASAPQAIAASTDLDVRQVDPDLAGQSLPLDTPVDWASDAFDGLGAAGLMSELEGLGRKSSFFGTGATGDRIVFVVDNSTSMTHGRMETALVELTRAIERLTPEQHFYVVFYSDMAYPLFYPSSATDMVPATAGNKERVRQWLETIETCWKTDGREAFSLALKLKPDVIFILGDGAIMDGADLELAQTPLPGVTIHTLGMQVQRSDARRFAAIARAHNGTYQDVGITPEGRQRLRKNGPIPRNKAPNGVWGLKLPMVPQ